MLKIMIVEDDPAVANLVGQFLEGEGFMSATTTDVPGAWRILSEDAPDAAIIDLSLPGSDSGWDLIEDLRNSEMLHDLPIVVLTGTPAEDVVERARKLSCVYLGKPFTSAALMDRLQIAIRRVGRGLQTLPLSVVVLTDRFRIEGTIHAPTDLSRFSDAWESLARDARAYVPVADAAVFMIADGSKIATADLIEVRKEEIVLASPRDGLALGEDA